jgi:hypothetical protein
MHKLLVLTATMAILLASSVAWKADAQTSRAAAIISAQAANMTPVGKIACWPGHHDGCPYHMKYRGRCIPCVHGPGY